MTAREMSWWVIGEVQLVAMLRRAADGEHDERPDR